LCNTSIQENCKDDHWGSHTSNILGKLNRLRGKNTGYIGQMFVLQGKKKGISAKKNTGFAIF
jgi:hypothetical protein